MGRNNGNVNIVDAIMLRMLFRLPFPFNLIFAIALFELVIVTVVVVAIVIATCALLYFVYWITCRIIDDVQLSRRDSERAAVLEIVNSSRLKELFEKTESSNSLPLIYVELQRPQVGDIASSALNEFLDFVQKCPDAETLSDLFRIVGREELNRRTAVRVARAKTAFLKGPIGVRLIATADWLRRTTDLADSDARAWLLFWSVSLSAVVFTVGCFLWYDFTYQAGKASADLHSAITSFTR